MNMRLLTIVVLSSLVLAGCGGADLIDNPMLDRWCGDRPCAWEVSGRVQRVGTWHTDDYALELLGRDSRISQHNAVVDAEDTRCLGFSFIADISSSARVFVELDFLDDGTVEFSQQIPASRWERRTFLIATPSWYEGVRFIVRKDGGGRAVVAELRARADTGCKRQPVELSNRPNGARCEQDDQCQSERCRSGRCSYCDSNLQCGTNQLCGLARVGGKVAERCVRPDSADFAEPCSSDEQCVEGTCCQGVCSQCCPGGVECEDDTTCALGNYPAGGRVQVPHQCGPGEGQIPRGGPCLISQDCQSRRCTGVAIDCASCRGGDEDAGVPDGEIPCQVDCKEWTLRGGTCE